MVSLLHLHLSPTLLHCHHHLQSPPRLVSLASFSFSSSSSSSRTSSPSSLRLPSLLPLCSSNGGIPDGSQFLDEDGLVQDMDGYLNYLSLEYDSVWDTKPSWCQPWSIVLTGVTAIGSSWVFLQSPVITAGVLSIICIWWYIFLYAYPKAYSNMIAERRKKVSSGIEDTFGVSNDQ